MRWYLDKLGFEIRTDVSFGEEERWLTIAPPQQTELEIVLHKAGSEEMKSQVGKQMQWVFDSENCIEDVAELKLKRVNFIREPEKVPWGTEAVLEDLYGNHWVIGEYHGR